MSPKKFEDEIDYVIPLSVRSIGQQTMLCTNWLVGFSSEKISVQQVEDPNLGKIINWLKSGYNDCPFSLELQLSNATVKYLWSLKDQLEVVNECLVYHWIGENESKVLLVVPDTLKQKAIKYCHNNKMSGHLGRDKTFSRLHQRFIWHGMYQDIILYSGPVRIVTPIKL